MDGGEDLLVRLADSVTSTVNPITSNDQRKQAYIFLEEFKEKFAVDQKMRIAEVLIRNERLQWNSSVLHFALKILEEGIRSSWTNLPHDRKVSIKTSVTNLTCAAIGKMDIADGIAKVLVEIIKRESSKDWPQILRELELLSEKGPPEMYIVSVLLMRLTDDIYRFKDGPSNTQRERLESFKNAMTDFIPFLIRSLLRSAGREFVYISTNLIQICSTIAEFAPVKFLWNQDGKLIDTILLQMIEYDALQLEIAEFLCNILERRHPKAGNIFLLMQFFGKPAYFNALSQHVQYNGALNEQTYKTCKRFCEVYAGLAFQLSLLDIIPDWLTQSTGSESPFQQYIRILFQLTSHQSPVISSIALSGWIFLWGHRIFPHLPELKVYGGPLLQGCLNLFLLQDLDHGNHVLELEFMHQEVEFREFLLSHRARITDLVRRIRKILPTETLEFALASLKLLLDKSENVLEPWSAMLSLLSNSVDPSRGTECISNLPRIQLIKHFRSQSFELLHRLINLEVNVEPGILSVRLSCISKLTTNFLVKLGDEDEKEDRIRRELLLKIYRFILQLIRDTTGSTDRATDELHFHGRNLLNSLCRNITETLVECYDEIVGMTIEFLTAGNGIFSLTDRCALLEGLIILTRSDNDLTKKSNLLSEILAAVSPIWQSGDFAGAMKTGSGFLKFFGLDMRINGGFEAPVLMERKQQLTFCSTIIAATVMNIRFFDPGLMGLLENAFGLLGSCLSLYDMKNGGMLPKENRKILELPDVERKAVLKPLFGDVAQSAGLSNEIIRMQNWMQTNFENACRTIGFAGRCFSSSLYDVPNLTSVINSTIIQPLGMTPIPMFRIRTIIRELMANYIRYCPEDRHESALVPVLSQFCSVMTRLLITYWNSLPAEDVTEQEEILHENLRQGFTTDYANLVLQRILCGKASSSGKEEEDVEMMEDVDDGQRQKTKSVGELSRLGILCLETSGFAESILITVFGALSWNDSQLSLRFTQLAQMIIMQLLKLQRSPFNGDGVSFLMQEILSGLKAHGQLENNQTPLLNLAVSAYVAFKPRFTEQVTRAFMTDLSFEHLDGILFPKPGGKISNDKFKREAFKKVFESSVKFLGDSSKQQVIVHSGLHRKKPDVLSSTSSTSCSTSTFVLDDHLNLPTFFGAL